MAYSIPTAPARPELVLASSYDENATGAVTLGSDHGSSTDADSELNFKGEFKLAAADDQAGPQSIAEPQAVILVMGVTGAGKSSFINCLTSRDEKISHGLKFCPSEVEIYPYITRKCTTFLVDTPGFGDMYRSDSEVLVEIARFLCHTYANGIKIAGIIYLHRITDCRMTGTSMRNLRLLHALCGETFLSNLVLATSVWDRLSNPRDQQNAQAREEALQKMDLWGYMLRMGAKMYRHNNTKESALRIVDHIQSLEGNMSLEIQQEMMQQKCNLDQTLAGQQVQKDLLATTEQYRKEWLWLLNEYAQAMNSKDLEWMESIEERRQWLGEEIAKLEGAKKGLRRDFGRLREEEKSRYQDKVDTLELENRRLMREDLTQDSRAIVGNSSHNSIWTQGVPREASKYKRSAAAAVDRGMTPFHAASFLSGGVPMCTAAFLAAAVIKESMQELTRRTGSCGEPLGVTSTDEIKKQDQRGAHGRTPNDSEPSSICSEESCVGDTPPSYPSPEKASQPDNESSQCYDLLRIDGSTKSADDEIVQNTPGGSEGCSYMTDSSLSEDATDWEEDSDLEHDVHQLPLSDSDQLLAESQKSLIQYVLDPTKREMVDRLMEEFWIILNRNWPIGARLCPAAPRNNSPSTSRGVSGSDNPSVTYSGGSLRAYEGGGKADKEPPDDRPGEGSGEPSNTPEFAPNTAQPIGFACPYRKRNPRKYCVKDWSSCALKPFKTVARVKAHLYRCHIIHQCQRCKCLFKSEEELDSHIETSERCDAILAPPVDGITRKMKAVLQCKRKAFPGQTEAERWKQIYQILFPDDEEVPDPYFEPMHDNEEISPHSPDLRDLSSYEQYLRHSLPRLVRSALETEINNHVQPIEERLREQLPDLVEHALSRAFLEYRTMADSNENVDPSLDSGYISNHSRSASSQDRKGKGPAIAPRAETAMRCTEYPNDAFESSNALSSPIIGTAPTSNLEISAPIHQSFEDMDSSEHPQFQEDISTESLFSERLFSSNSAFPDQLGDPTSDMMDMDSFNWELPHQEGPCSNY